MEFRHTLTNLSPSTEYEVIEATRTEDLFDVQDILGPAVLLKSVWSVRDNRRSQGEDQRYWT